MAQVQFQTIHPFRDGNGRVSRLLTLLALYQHGYEVGRYISLERLIEESKGDYYHVLQQSSQRWHEGKHELLPWLNHFLAIVRRGYSEFEKRAGDVKTRRGAKSALVAALRDYHVACAALRRATGSSVGAPEAQAQTVPEAPSQQ